MCNNATFKTLVNKHLTDNLHKQKFSWQCVCKHFSWNKQWRGFVWVVSSITENKRTSLCGCTTHYKEDLDSIRAFWSRARCHQCHPHKQPWSNAGFLKNMQNKMNIILIFQELYLKRKICEHGTKNIYSLSYKLGQGTFKAYYLCSCWTL